MLRTTNHQSEYRPGYSQFTASWGTGVLTGITHSYLDSPLRCGAVLVDSDGLELGFCVGLVEREGEANRSSVSESEISRFPISGVAISEELKLAVEDTWYINLRVTRGNSFT